ncbi:MAG: hypothetical protein H6745_27245 [Deltaproteobacteria bacterium]|nr:hypothetical protein [Deltaproteobacteria bacterium]
MPTTDTAEKRLEAACAAAGLKVSVVVTDNRVRLVSAKRADAGYELRVAAPVLELGGEAEEALVDWLAGTADGRARLRAIVSRVPPRAPRRPRKTRIETLGLHHDLHAIAEAERRRYFPDVPPIPITWGAARRAHRRRRSIRLGSYDVKRAVVRIHRDLDHPRVPSWFIGFVVYHELLHHVMRAPDGGPLRHHTREFRAREAQHHLFREAIGWERAHLQLLLSGRL